MKYLISAVVLMLLVVSFSACKKEGNTEESKKMIDSLKDTIRKEMQAQDTLLNLKARTYVSEGYAKRAEGEEWMAVKMDSITSDTINVVIFSGPKNQKICNFNTRAFELEKGIFKSINTSPIVLFTIDDEDLVISSIDKGSEEILKNFCSGNANIAGKYLLLHEPIDTVQIDSLQIQK